VILWVNPRTSAWPLGRSRRPRGVKLWVGFDRSSGIVGPPGSGKTVHAVAHAALAAPGALLHTATKPADVLLSYPRRSAELRPVAVCDPLGLLPGLPALVWDPLAGCADAMVASRRANAFVAGTMRLLVSANGADYARFHAAEAAKLLQVLFHAAALSGRTMTPVVEWLTDPAGMDKVRAILGRHPYAQPQWEVLLATSLRNPPDVVANTLAVARQAIEVLVRPGVAQRSLPRGGVPPTDLAELIRAGGTVYLLGTEDPYVSVSPLLTAIAENVLETAEALSETLPYGRLVPPLVAALDDLPLAAPIPSLPQRLPASAGRGLCLVWSASNWPQLITCYGEESARTILDLTDVLVLFGGGRHDPDNRSVGALVSMAHAGRHSADGGPVRRGKPAGLAAADSDHLDVAEGEAVILAEDCPAFVARMRGVLDGRTGARLRSELAAVGQQIDRHSEQRRDLWRHSPTSAGWQDLRPDDADGDGGTSSYSAR
jgi:type IV secretion system protein VirD4